MSLLDFFTGGADNAAQNALDRSREEYSNVDVPTVAQLTLPQLQQYVDAGLMTPAEAQSYLQQSNAFSGENIDQTGTGAEKTALGELSDIASAGDMGTPVEQATVENALERARTETGGQRGAIEQSMAARGTPYSLIQGALENQTVGQDAQQAHMDAVNAASGAYQNAIAAAEGAGNIGANLQGQMNTQANTVAGAQNAMEQFNAANQQATSEANAARRNAANLYNTENKQNVSNANTGLANTRTTYNAGLPQQVFQDKMSRASGMAGADTNMAKLQQDQGKQTAGIYSGIINGVASMATPPVTPPATPPVEGPQFPGQGYGYAEGGVIGMDDGGMVPGEANFPGDTTMNDTVPIHASPGEAVIPRSSVAQNPDEVMNLINGGQDQAQVIDPTDVATLLKALRAIRLGAA